MAKGFDNLDDLLRHAEREAKDPKANWDRRAQTKLLYTFQSRRSYVSPKQLDALARLFCTHLHMPRERFDLVYQLGSIEEVAQALAYVPPRVPRDHTEEDREALHVRMRGEEHYPRTGWIGDYLLHTQETNSSLGYHFWTAVGVLGAAARRNLFFNRGEWVLRPNHYIILIGHSGIGKGIALNVGGDIVDRLNRQLHEAVPKGADVNPNDHLVNKTIHRLPESVTPERMINLLQSKPMHCTAIDGGGGYLEVPTDAACMLISREASVLLGKNVFHAGKQVHVLTDHWDCHPYWINETIGRGGEVLRNICYTLLLGSTIDWMRTSIAEETFTGGFMGRCIVVSRDTSRYHQSDMGVAGGVVDPISAEFLARRLHCWVTMGQPDEVIMTPQAGRLFDEWDREHENSQAPDKRMQGYWTRKPNHVIKLAMVLAMSQGSTVMEESDIDDAIEILRAEDNQAYEAIQQMGASVQAQLVDHVEYALEHRLGGYASQSDLGKATYGRVGGSFELGKITRTLVQQGKIESVIKGTGRKQTQYWKTVPQRERD